MAIPPVPPLFRRYRWRNPMAQQGMAVGAIPPYRRALRRRRNETGEVAPAVRMVERPESGLIPPDRAAE